MIVNGFIGEFHVSVCSFGFYSLSDPEHTEFDFDWFFLYRSLPCIQYFGFALLCLFHLQWLVPFTPLQRMSVWVCLYGYESHEANPRIKPENEKQMERSTKKNTKSNPTKMFRLFLVYVLNVKAVRWILEDAWLRRWAFRRVCWKVVESMKFDLKYLWPRHR